MRCLLVLLACCAGRAAAAPYNVEPDYAAAILSLGELDHGKPDASYASAEGTPAQQQRKEEEQERLEGIRQYILGMLNLPCVPRPPPYPAITTQNVRLFNQLMDRLQNQTVPERGDLLRRAQSFYPSCETPELIEDTIWEQQDSMNVYFNLSLFFLTQPDDVTIDAAELRLYKLAAPEKTRQRQRLQVLVWPMKDREDDKVRVSIYMYSTTPDLGNEENDTQLVDSVMVSRYGSHWITFDVRPAVRRWSAEHLNLGLRVTVEDVKGRTLPTEDFFENMDCNVPDGGPVPGYLLKLAKEQDLTVQLKHHFPVLDLRTAETADPPPLNGRPLSTAPCPSTPGPYLAADAGYQPLYAGAEALRPAAAELRQRPEHRRRRHRHQRHHRRHSTRRARPHRGQQ